VHTAPAHAGRPRFEIADIVRRHRAALEAEQDLTLSQRRVLSAIELCRTAALGGHLEACRSCGYEKPAYNSCRNRHCPKCQALAQERWIAARSQRLLPVRHFHLVFTLPSELRPLARFAPKHVFDALFRAASQTLLDLGRSRLGAQLGITMVLHTWTRELRFHPHVHAIVTAGGLSDDGKRWIDSRRRYLFPAKVMSLLLRGKTIALLRRLCRRGAFAGYRGFTDPIDFERLIASIARKRWVVYAKAPFRRSIHVVHYLGRYTHRVGIANSRLVKVTERTVAFRTKNGRTTTISPLEFLRRFVLHVLPPGYVKIRHYGLLAGGCAGRRETARALFAQNERLDFTSTLSLPWHRLLARLTGRDVHRCPRCEEPLALLPLPARQRAPPHAA
jgi:hypothetical protein